MGLLKLVFRSLVWVDQDTTWRAALLRRPDWVQLVTREIEVEQALPTEVHTIHAVSLIKRIRRTSSILYKESLSLYSTSPSVFLHRQWVVVL